MLNETQINEVKKEMVTNGQPVRFLKDGQNINICTGEMLKKGTNVLYHFVYWNFSRKTSIKIANWLNAKPVFC